MKGILKVTAKGCTVRDKENIVHFFGGCNNAQEVETMLANKNLIVQHGNGDNANMRYYSIQEVVEIKTLGTAKVKTREELLSAL